MEAFEHLVKAYLEGLNYVVTSNVKFHVRRKTKKKAYDEYQTHGYEMDLVAARHNSLRLASVKSFLGSRGVNRQGFEELADPRKRTDFGGYRVFNDVALREEIQRVAHQRYGYPLRHISFGLYVGKFATSEDERAIRCYLTSIGVEVVGLRNIVGNLIDLGNEKTYDDDPVIVTVKALKAAGYFNTPRGKA